MRKVSLMLCTNDSGIALPVGVYIVCTVSFSRNDILMARAIIKSRHVFPPVVEVKDRMIMQTSCLECLLIVC